MQHKNLGGLDSAYLLEKFFADFFPVRRAQNNDMAVSSFSKKPFHGVQIAVAAAH